jgi:hypothetical protein
MAVCPQCGGPFLYTETHVCPGRDRTKLSLLASATAGALIGGPLGLRYGNSIVSLACERPGAGNLCGLTSAPAVPFYIVIGAVVGASIAALGVAVLLGRRKT